MVALSFGMVLPSVRRIVASDEAAGTTARAFLSAPRHLRSSDNMAAKEAAMWGAHEGMGWWMMLGSVWFAIFWLVVIWVGLSIYNRAGKSREASPLDIARKRYAAGEINREEFERIRQDLGS
jgi:putative membrane protein